MSTRPLLQPAGYGLLLGLLALTPPLSAQETVVYEQRFVNLTGANAESSTVGWSLYGSSNPLGTSTNADGTLTITATSGTQGGVSGGIGGERSFDDQDKGFIYMYDGNAANLLAVSNQSVDRESQAITKIEFVMRDHSNGFSYTAQVAVQVAGQWYVNEELFTVANPPPATTAYTARTFAWKTTGWRKLVFDPANVATLAIGADPAADLPAGNLANFGFFLVHPATGGSVVLDEVAVWAAPVASSTLVYEQRFVNLTGANAEFTTLGADSWSAYGNMQPSAINLNSPFGTVLGGYSGGIGGELSFDDQDKGFLFLYGGNPEAILAMSNTTIDRDSQEIVEIGFYLRDHSNGFRYTVHPAVQVGGQWYANAESFSPPTPAPAATAYTPRTFTWTTSNWIRITFDSANPATLALGADPAADLPDGDVTNFGFFILHPGGGSAIIDEVTVSVAAGPASPQAVYAAVAPVVDGAVDPAWDAAPVIPIALPVKTDQNNTAAVATDIVASFSALFDGAKLYLLVEVKDDVVQAYGKGWWVDDGVEIYLDPDSSRGATYDKVNDLQLGLLPTDPANTLYYGSNSIKDLAGITSTATIGSGGYVMEMSLPWTSLKVDPAALSAIGIEVAINDGDPNQGNWPPARLGWVSEGNDAASKPSVFGILPLVGMPFLSSCFYDLGSGFRWAPDVGYIYDGFFPFVYAYSANNWLYLYAEGATEAGGYYIYDFGRAQFGYTGCDFYPNYVKLPLTDPAVLVGWGANLP